MKLLQLKSFSLTYTYLSLNSLPASLITKVQRIMFYITYYIFYVV